MSSFTPGPWEVSPQEIDVEPFSWGVYRPGHNTKWFGVAAARTKEDARLIAAAPDLYAALRALNRYAASDYDDFTPCWCRVPGLDRHEDSGCSLARAAMAKAEGKKLEVGSNR